MEKVPSSLSKKTLFGLVGLMVFVIGMYVNKGITTGEKTAAALDKTDTMYGYVDGPPPCDWEVEAPERVVSESKTQAILINTSNKADTGCETLLYLRAPGFDITPSSDNQKIILTASSSGSVSWILSPRKTGSYEISVTDSLNTKIYGIVVKNMFGLSASQGKVASMLGTIFGPMLTIPWWWDRLKKPKKE